MQSSEEKTKIEKMFGFIVEEPIHVSLRRMRLLTVGMLINSQLLLWVIVQKLSFLDPVQAAMAYSAIALTLITSIWKGIDNLSNAHKKDE